MVTNAGRRSRPEKWAGESDSGVSTLARILRGMPIGTRIDATPEQLAAVKFDSDGLVAAIAQDVDTGEVLMVAWMNAESLARTFDEGRMVYWSRSRRELWRKGDTSGDRQYVREAYYDCDGDALLFRVEQEGAGACHTGARTCFFRKFGS
jgi:phosphoribosyl-AMP cyclohydrolase/phosphoribosyl-ATP pyrophosphohydrolase/phosphoribosyl-AMP cyclohydrolase